jgi:hypothetical protein
MIRKQPLLLVVLICMMMAGFTIAQDDDATASTSTSTSTSDGLGWRGWGIGVGLASGPDQALLAFHFDVGEFTEHVWFNPDVVLGIGDDTISVVASAPVWYRFELDGKITPYVGGALAAGFFRVDKDNGNGSDNNFELGLQIGGGAEWQLRSGRRFRAELRLDVIDVWDLTGMASWTF